MTSHPKCCIQGTFKLQGPRERASNFAGDFSEPRRLDSDPRPRCKASVRVMANSFLVTALRKSETATEPQKSLQSNHRTSQSSFEGLGPRPSPFKLWGLYTTSRRGGNLESGLRSFFGTRSRQPWRGSGVQHRQIHLKALRGFIGRGSP